MLGGGGTGAGVGLGTSLHPSSSSPLRMALTLLLCFSFSMTGRALDRPPWWPVCSPIPGSSRPKTWHYSQALLTLTSPYSATRMVVSVQVFRSKEPDHSRTGGLGLRPDPWGLAKRTASATPSPRGAQTPSLRKDLQGQHSPAHSALWPAPG